MVESAKLLGADEETAKKEMKKALEFEIKLANATTAREFRRDPNNLYNPTTLDQFENEGYALFQKKVSNEENPNSISKL